MSRLGEINHPRDGLALDACSLVRCFRRAGLALELHRQLGLDTFFAAHLPPSRKGTRWEQIRQVLVPQRLLAPGSAWHLPRDWFERTALADLLGGDGGLAECHKRYATLAQVLPLKEKHGQARRVWLMDRGIPTEAVLEQMRASDPSVN